MPWVSDDIKMRFVSYDTGKEVDHVVELGYPADPSLQYVEFQIRIVDTEDGFDLDIKVAPEDVEYYSQLNHTSFEQMKLYVFSKIEEGERFKNPYSDDLDIVASIC